MLVLSRKPQEQIQIGDNVTVTVLKVKGNTVSLGIEAPQDIRIVRSELPRFDSQEKPANAAVRETPAGEVPPAPKAGYMSHRQESASLGGRNLESPRAQGPLHFVRHVPIASDHSGSVRPR